MDVEVRLSSLALPLVLTLAGSGVSICGLALVSGNRSAGVGFVVALLHSESRPFLDQVSPKSSLGVYRESR